MNFDVKVVLFLFFFSNLAIADPSKDCLLEAADEFHGCVSANQTKAEEVGRCLESYLKGRGKCEEDFRLVFGSATDFIPNSHALERLTHFLQAKLGCRDVSLSQGKRQGARRSWGLKVDSGTCPTRYELHVAGERTWKHNQNTALLVTVRDDREIVYEGAIQIP